MKKDPDGFDLQLFASAGTLEEELHEIALALREILRVLRVTQGVPHFQDNETR